MEFKYLLIIIGLLLILLGFFILSSHNNEYNLQRDYNLMGKKVLMVIAPGEFRDEEYFKPKEILENAGVEITTASIKEGEFTGMLGAKVYAKSLDDINLDDYDGIIFVGGIGVAKHGYFENEKILNLARYFYEKGKIVGAECIAPMILAKAGILKDKSATIWKDAELIEEFKSLGVNYVDKSVVVDGKIITGNGPTAAEEFGKKYLELLTNQ